MASAVAGNEQREALGLVSEAIADKEKPKESSEYTKLSSSKSNQETDELEKTLKLALAASPLPVEYNDFWSVHLPQGDVVGSSRIPSINASLPKRRGNLPFWRVSESLVDSVYDVYKVASEQAQSMLADEE